MELFLCPIMYPQISVSIVNKQMLPLMVMLVHVADSEVVELGHVPQFDAMIL